MRLYLYSITSIKDKVKTSINLTGKYSKFVHRIEFDSKKEC